MKFRQKPEGKCSESHQLKRSKPSVVPMNGKSSMAANVWFSLEMFDTAAVSAVKASPPGVPGAERNACMQPSEEQQGRWLAALI